MAPDLKIVKTKNVPNYLKINLASSYSLLLQNSLDERISNPFYLEHLDTKRYGNTGCEGEFCEYGWDQGQNIESQPKSKGQLNSEWIYEVIISPKMPTENYQDFCPGSF